MRAPTRVLRANGVTQTTLARVAGQTVQYVSMQLNGHRTLTMELSRALSELLPADIAAQVINRRGEE